MNPWLALVLGILATYRVAGMVATEAGPGRIFERLRRAPSNKTVREGLACPLCESVWWAAGVATFYGWLGTIQWGEWPVWWLALSGGSVVVWRQWPKK